MCRRRPNHSACRNKEMFGCGLSRKAFRCAGLSSSDLAPFPGTPGGPGRVITTSPRRVRLFKALQCGRLRVVRPRRGCHSFLWPPHVMCQVTDSTEIARRSSLHSLIKRSRVFPISQHALFSLFGLDSLWPGDSLSWCL